MKRKKFKLYHITNSIFLDSIKEFGLGAVDPVKENNLLEILDFLSDLCDQKIPDNETVKSYRQVTNFMINQKNSVVKNPITKKYEKHNFSHGKLYLSANETRAALYGALTKYGSEILTRIIKYMTLLEENGINYNLDKFPNSLDFKQITNINPKIIMIKFDYFEGLVLEFEDKFDKTINEKAFTNIEYFNQRIEDPNFSSKLRFKTTNVVPANALKFFELRVDRDSKEEFNYILIKM